MKHTPFPDGFRIVPHAPVPLDLTDRAVFAAVVQEHHRPLTHYALRLTRDAPQAADIVQDVFLAVWERRHEIDAGASFRALLFTMVRHRSLNTLRTSRFRATDTDLDAVMASADGAAGADALLEASDVRARLQQWVGEMPARRAEAFMLSRDQGLSSAEIAEVMSVSVRTVETHVYHALTALRARLEAHDPSPRPTSP